MKNRLLLLAFMMAISFSAMAQSGNYFNFVQTNGVPRTFPISNINLVYEATSSRSELITGTGVRYLIAEDFDSILARLCDNLLEVPLQNGKRVGVNFYNIDYLGKMNNTKAFFVDPTGDNRFITNLDHDSLVAAIVGCAVGGGPGGGEANVGANLGGGIGVYANKAGVQLRFKSFVAGANVTITEDANEILISAAGGGGGGGGDLLTYSAGSGVLVKATDAGVTATKGGGSYTITVPDGVEIVSARVNGATADLDGNNALTIVTNWVGSTGYNTSASNIWPPNAQIVNTASLIGGGPGPALPFILSEATTPQQQIIGVGTNSVTYRAINMNSFSTWVISLNY